MGFLSLIPARVWEYIAILIALAAFGGYMFWRGGEGPRAELATVKAQYAAFQSQVKVLGDNAQKAAEAREKADKLAKETADAQNVKAKSDLDVLYANYRKLRQSASNNSIGGLLPKAAPASANPERACFQREALDSAISSLDSGVTSLLEKGDAAIVNLDTARRWAASP